MKESKVAGGRVGVYIPDHPRASGSGYVPRSRMVMEEKLGRLLGKNECVHHLNGDPRDDRIENLEVVSRSEHSKEHWRTGEYSGDRFRRLDYRAIRKLREVGLGYRRIAKKLGIPRTSVRYACRAMKKK